MIDQIESTIGLKLSNKFNEIVYQFEKHFGTQIDAYEGFALENFLRYMNIAWLANKHEVRNYGYVPFEAELPFPTGTDGNHQGWLNLCPELENFKKPFICWFSCGETWYCGKDETEIMQNIIKRFYSYNNYEHLDLKFLDSIGVNPYQGDDYKYIDGESIGFSHGLPKIPVNLPSEYRYEMTYEGVGIITKKKYFSKTDSHISRKRSIEEYMELATKYEREGLFGSSIFYLKEAYFKLGFKLPNKGGRFEILVMLKESFEAIGKTELADVVNIELESKRQIIDWIEQNTPYLYTTSLEAGHQLQVILDETYFEKHQIDKILLLSKEAGIKTGGDTEKHFDLNFSFRPNRPSQIKIILEKIKSIVKETIEENT